VSSLVVMLRPSRLRLAQIRAGNPSEYWGFLGSTSLRTPRQDLARAVSLLVLDLSDVTFLGSAGLAVLVAAKDEAAHRRR
jgi:hypothetical protein